MIGQDGQPQTNLHASCVALGARAVLIIGPSGAGKSQFALALMAFGATLVADDRTILTRRGAQVWATCPPAILGQIEARGLGILHAQAQTDGAEVVLVLDLAQRETDRLPPQRHCDLLGRPIPLVLGQDHAHFPASIVQYLRAGRRA